MKSSNILVNNNNTPAKLIKAFSINFGPQHLSAHDVLLGRTMFPTYKVHNIMRKFFVVLFGPQFDNFTSVLNYKMGC